MAKSSDAIVEDAEVDLRLNHLHDPDKWLANWIEKYPKLEKRFFRIYALREAIAQFESSKAKAQFPWSAIAYYGLLSLWFMAVVWLSLSGWSWAIVATLEAGLLGPVIVFVFLRWIDTQFPRTLSFLGSMLLCKPTIGFCLSMFAPKFGLDFSAELEHTSHPIVDVVALVIGLLVILLRMAIYLGLIDWGPNRQTKPV